MSDKENSKLLRNVLDLVDYINHNFEESKYELFFGVVISSSLPRSEYLRCLGDSASEFIDVGIYLKDTAFRIKRNMKTRDLIQFLSEFDSSIDLIII